MRLLKNIAPAILVLVTSDFVQALEAVRPLAGYKCFRVYVPEEKRFDPTASRPVFAAPTEASKLIGHAGGFAFVKWPLNETDGFVEIAWGQRGIKAWIHKDVLRPWRNNLTPPGPASECVPSVMSDGTIGKGNGLPYPQQ